jgi:hypothetical protein
VSRLLAGLASAVLLVLVLSAFGVPDLPAFAAAPLVALAVIAAWRVEYGLLVLAAALPMSSWIGRGWTDSGLSWPNAVLMAFACGYFACSSRRPDTPDVPLRNAVQTLAAIVCASLVVQLAVYHERLGGDAFLTQLGEIVRRDFFIPGRNWPAVTATALILEGLVAFYAAARSVQRSPGFARHLASAAVIGAVAAAAINSWRVVAAAAGDASPLSRFAELVLTQRINEHYDDVNAAGSYFMLMLWIALGLAREQKPWGIAAAVVAAGLWLTSSRAAFVAGLLAAGVPWLLAGRRRLSRSVLIRTAAIVGALVVLAAAAAVVMPARGLQKSPSTAIEVRMGLAEAALKMVAARPVFGIGIGEFYQRSGEFSSEKLKALFPRASNENAHNNFLQVFAELGTVGVIALVWILAIAAWRAWFLIRRDRPEPLELYLTAGVTGFVLTWLGGHPMLIAEAAGTFWLALGTVAGLGASAVPPPATRRVMPAHLVAVLGLLLAITVPVRARYQIGDTNLEHVGIGLSGWHRTSENQAYRNAGIDCSLFVPADASTMNLPLRAAVDAAIVEVEMRMDGRLANVVRIAGDRWTNVRVIMPDAGRAPRFRRVDLHVAGDPPRSTAGVVLLVGKVVPY